MFTYSGIFQKKQRVLFVTAHPDDVVAFFGALIHQLRQDKKEVFVLLVTNGARGSRNDEISEAELAKKRLLEEIEALQSLGVDEDHFSCLGYADGEVESNLQLIGEISKQIRKLKVDIVCTHEPSLQYSATYDKTSYFVQHRDHRKVGEATIDAVYPFSRDRSFFTEHYAESIEPHSVFEILLTDEKDSNFDLDFTEHTQAKKAALSKYHSQFDADKVDYILAFNKFNDKHIEKFLYLNLA